MPSENTSATGGYLVATNESLEGIPFRRFIGSVLVSISGLPPANVRPAWQTNPPPIPDVDTNWMAFGQTNRRGNYSTYQRVSDDGNESFQLQQEECDFALTVYGPDCLEIAGNVRDAFDIQQNQAQLQISGMGVIGITDILHVPELINDRYFDRADMTITIRREIRRNYKVLSFTGVYGTIKANQAGNSVLTQNFGD